MQDKILVIMGLVEDYHEYGHISYKDAIESKLSELVREPLSVQYPDDMNSIAAKFVFSAGWKAAERSHNISNASGVE